MATSIETAEAKTRAALADARANLNASQNTRQRVSAVTERLHALAARLPDEDRAELRGITSELADLLRMAYEAMP